MDGASARALAFCLEPERQTAAGQAGYRKQQHLAADRGSVTWMRSGAGPEAWRVTFELSADGVTYVPLGEGTRISGGWQLGGLALPRGQNLFIRARGDYASGLYTGSGSVVESVRNVYLMWRVYLPLVLR